MKIPKKKIVYVPKIKKVYVPSKKKIIVQRPRTSTVPVPKASYATTSYGVPQTQSYRAQVPIAQPTMVVPQRSIVQAPIQTQLAQPMVQRPIPYGVRTISGSSYRPSLQLPAANMGVQPYKQATYRPNLRTRKVVRRPIQVMRAPVPVRTIAPVTQMTSTMPNVSSYRPVQQPTLPVPVAQPQTQYVRPPVITQPAMPTVRQISTIPQQTAVVQQIPTAKPQIPVVSQVPVRQVPVQQVPVQSYRPQVATYRPANVNVNMAQNVVRPPVQPVQQMVPNVQNVNMMRPGVYNASTYRPTNSRVGGLGYRPVVQNYGNTMNNPGEYGTRTYRPRKL